MNTNEILKSYGFKKNSANKIQKIIKNGTLIASYKRMNLNREQEAIAAYLNLLTKKGCEAQLLMQREVFLAKLSTYLQDKSTAGTDYREAVEALMETRPAESWPSDLITAREYYPFWMNDMKMISMFVNEAMFRLKPVVWNPEPLDLGAVWNNIDQEKFSTPESWAIKAYTKAMRDEDAPQELIDKRVKLAKMLLVRLRDAPAVESNIFRIAVDATAPLFNLREARQMFLVVVREFFYFWSANPNAQDYILRPNKASIL